MIVTIVIILALCVPPRCQTCVKGSTHIISFNHHKALLWEANIMGPVEQRGKLCKARLGMQAT